MEKKWTAPFILDTNLLLIPKTLRFKEDIHCRHCLNAAISRNFKMVKNVTSPQN